MTLEPQDIELLESFQQLSPLLQAASAYHRAKDEEPQSKKSRHVAPEDPGNQVAPTPQQAVLTLTKILTQVVLQHERQLQAIHRQESFVFLRPAQQAGMCPTVGTEDQGMEGSGSVSGHAWVTKPDPAHISTPCPDSGTPGQSSEALQVQTRGGALGHGSQQQDDQCRRIMAFPALEPREAGFGEFSSPCASDAAGPQRVGSPVGTSPGQRPCDEISCPATTAAGRAVAAPNPSSPGRFVAHPSALGSELHLGHAGRLNEGALSEAGQDSRGLAADDPGSEDWQRTQQRSLQGEAPQEAVVKSARDYYSQALERLCLTNPSSLCYANSAVLSFLWATLSRAAFRPGDWGVPRALFQDLLDNPSQEPVNLAIQPWMRALLLDWDDNEGQADSAEFTNRLIRWVQPACVNNRWHRRVCSGENLPAEIHDFGDRFMPVVLQIDPVYIHNDSIRLQDLIRCWHNELVCVHIDRFIQRPAGGVRKLHISINFHWTVNVPIFDQEGVSCTWESYQMVAAFAHFGTESHGHYQALLRAPFSSDEVEPAVWLHCDDGRQPQRCIDLPGGFAAGVTCIWLCHGDAVALPLLQESPPPTVSHGPSARDDFLALLQDT